jgi:alpha-tubulin suppressor-like RCC1 family protein
MATYYNFTEAGKVRSFDDTFIPKYPTLGGQIFTAGENSYGEGLIGDGNSSAYARSTPKQEITFSNNWRQVSAGYYTTSAIKNDGTLWGWGWNKDGIVGDNSTTSRSSPRQEATSSTNWKQVTSFGSVLAIKNDGSLWAWGDNGVGQLADGTNTRRLTPRQISFSTFNSVYGDGRSGWKFVDISGVQNMVAVRNDGTLWSWGFNGYGQVGDGTTGATGGTNTRSTPRQISVGANRITGWKMASCGFQHKVALHSDGTIWSWGRNHTNQLANNTSVDSPTPVQEFSASNNWKFVVAGRYSSMAIKEDGTLWVWGYNGFGQLGVNDTAQRPTPTPIWNSRPEWRYVDSGEYATAAIKTNGELWTWGSGNSPQNSGNAGDGQLGTNDRVQRNTPVPIVFAGDNKWKDVSIGFGHVVAVKLTE